MAVNNLLAKQYSLAALNVAKKLNLLDVFESDLQKLSAAFSKEMLRDLSNPVISKDALIAVVSDLAAKLSLNENVTGFLKVVAENKRISNIKQIAQSFSDLIKSEKNILEVEVISASDLDEQSLVEIKELLAKKYSGKNIQIKKSIKKDILGGVQIKIESMLIDASLKQQLINLNQQFQSIL